MSGRDFRTPDDDPGSADPVADGEPTTATRTDWTDEPPGTGDWKDADNADDRAADRDREIEATGDGRHAV
jgi:hypothetical protein